MADLLRRKAVSAEKMLMKSGLFDVVDVRCVTRDDLRELYKRATQAVPATFEMPKKMSLPRMPGVEESLLGLLSARAGREGAHRSHRTYPHGAVP
ncbi:hypothetical protein [Paractinoplanes hotanensis]|uniref:Uncharacterized protein n=1 Tax=Paractinoplanes hotanensis TaxID=2906497 RepID=A0ABT0YGM5_9ACTN|nr:hypothetical protein [Actinoplanes hotanensis]MCM4085196.1 hypothetical protein [Actinoplanes hotanensis]